MDLYYEKSPLSYGLMMAEIKIQIFSYKKKISFVQKDNCMFTKYLTILKKTVQIHVEIFK